MAVAQGISPSSKEVRKQLIEALRLDLVGPWAGHDLSDEALPGRERPSNRYLTGFLIPRGTPQEHRGDADEDDDLDEVPESSGLIEESNEERKTAKKAYFPSSMGLSFLLRSEVADLEVVVRWGDYTRTQTEDEDGKKDSVWQRHPKEVTVPVALGGNEERTQPVPDSSRLQLHLVERVVSGPGMGPHLPPGTRSVSLFLVNDRAPDTDQPDLAYIFQAEVEVRCGSGFVPRPDPRGMRAEDWDEQVADLHYADSPEYAVGHGVSAEWEVVEDSCQVVRTAWIPSAEVEKTAPVDVPGVVLSMDQLGSLEDGHAARQALTALVERYGKWIKDEGVDLAGLSSERQAVAKQVLATADVARDRIAKGIEVLATDDQALEAFRVANRAVGRALRQRLQIDHPEWRPFQLAFILLNLPGLADPHETHRETIDLLFFPTGGGKTEAYFGLAAFAIMLRRLRNQSEGAPVGAGVSVMMRYTLRLLTLDQLMRAGGLVCALELERAADETRFGTWPIEIGLWVGKAATPNVMGRKGEKRPDSARAKVRRFKANPKGNPSPIPLEECPWCRSRFEPASFTLLPNDDQPTELRIVCTNFECEFSGDKPLPILAIDDVIYRRLPAFLIATVDKFASLPWVGTAGLMLGGADRHDTDGFYGAAEPARGKPLPKALAPPDLIIQDELHLISGPLGTMAGLYETAVEALCIRDVGGQRVRPKIVASTATVRRAQDQIQALFGRPLTQIFPPPGPDRRDSFFAETVPSHEVPARAYVGVAAQGRNPKVVMRKVWLALMGAAELAYHGAGGRGNADNPADPYMTVIGYFISLRELGGARRILEEEVQNTLKSYGGRKRVGSDPGLFRDRKSFTEVLELTSRVPTDKVAEARRRMEQSFDRGDRVDCVLATNMISVGLDVPRLGLMVVHGQPKTHAEYIQATSRVGRDDTKPGLVVTVLNIHKPRDRSHYERFRHYHETFYRSVEASSVTPFSARALDRGMAGALVTLARHSIQQMTPASGAQAIAGNRAELERRLLEAFRDRVNQQPIQDGDERDERLRSVQNRVVDLLDSWRKIFEDYAAAGVGLQYQKNELSQPRPLLREMLDDDFESEHHRKFRVSRSLRDVEPEVELYLQEMS